jgi:putative ABC transport system ATP-binding protein
MIQISQLHFRYAQGGFALRVPDLQVDRGETVAMIGPSGSGKTTLLSLMAGIRTPASGSIRTAGEDVVSLDETGRRDFRIRFIGLVFQEFELLEYLSVLDNVLLPFRISPALRLDDEVRERAAELGREVGLGDKLGRHANEPTGNLDPTNKDHVLDILFDYARSSGATLVTVTHDHDLLGRFDRVIDFKDFYDLGPESAAPAEASR